MPSSWAQTLKLTENEISMVFHYQASTEVFKYLQDLSEEEYVPGRYRSLNDASKMIRLGIYPDLAALFHNRQNSRLYILLVDLLVPILDGNDFRPRGGAGRLGEAFNLDFPNERASGLTDLRDAWHIWKKNPQHLTTEFKDLPYHDYKDSKKFFLQMHALSRVLLIDMLILIERYKRKGILNLGKCRVCDGIWRRAVQGICHCHCSLRKPAAGKGASFCEGMRN